MTNKDRQGHTGTNKDKQGQAWTDRDKQGQKGNVHVCPCLVPVCPWAVPGIDWHKGHRPSADLRYKDEDTISPSNLILAARKGSVGIFTLLIPPDVPKKLALR